MTACSVDLPDHTHARSASPQVGHRCVEGPLIWSLVRIDHEGTEPEPAGYAIGFAAGELSEDR